MGGGGEGVRQIFRLERWGSYLWDCRQMLDGERGRSSEGRRGSRGMGRRIFISMVRYSCILLLK